jgi:hypothetical protein
VQQHNSRRAPHILAAVKPAQTASYSLLAQAAAARCTQRAAGQLCFARILCFCLADSIGVNLLTFLAHPKPCMSAVTGCWRSSRTTSRTTHLLSSGTGHKATDKASTTVTSGLDVIVGVRKDLFPIEEDCINGSRTSYGRSFCSYPGFEKSICKTSWAFHSSLVSPLRLKRLSNSWGALVLSVKLNVRLLKYSSTMMYFSDRRRSILGLRLHLRPRKR